MVADRSLFIRCGTQYFKANNIYQDYIRDKNHLHMNATRWGTLGQAGIVRVEDTEEEVSVSWVDNSSKALAKAVTHIYHFWVSTRFIDRTTSNVMEGVIYSFWGGNL
jgi:Domain of Kin17 curved DNA-binding protein